MGEGGVGGKVTLQSGALDRGGRLGEEVDDLRDLGGYGRSAELRAKEGVEQTRVFHCQWDGRVGKDCDAIRAFSHAKPVHVIFMQRVHCASSACTSRISYLKVPCTISTASSATIQRVSPSSTV